MIASPKCISCGMMGRSSVRITSPAVMSKRLPSSPPGWNWAKSCGRKLRTCISAMAKASPMAKAAVVLLVGARLSGHASFFTHTWMCALLYFANSDCGLAVIEMIGMFIWSTIGINRSNSSVCPELLSASTTSSAVITPKSPWYTSKGLMKKAGVPVDASVAAIFAPIFPLFPTPVTMIFPWQAYIISTALVKFSSTCGMSSWMASASSLSAWMPHWQACLMRVCISLSCSILQ